MDDEVDAVLLDRRMPDVHGDEVLARLREEGCDCPVIMTTAVDPGMDILEMDFEDYLCKPVLGTRSSRPSPSTSRDRAARTTAARSFSPSSRSSRCSKRRKPGPNSARARSMHT